MSIFKSSKTYELPLSKDYVRHWGMSEAVRELIQNGLDSDSPFEWETREEDQTLVIRSRFAKLEPKTLLLGHTTKADSDKIGSFGEGYKIALLVLTRCGYEVQVRNGDRLWRPKFMYSHTFESDVLCIEDSAAPSRTEGVEFVVTGLTPSEFVEIRNQCLHMQNDIGETLTVSSGRILRARPGKLYVGGLYVCDTKLAFGYDVKPEFMRLERDRKTVDSFDLLFLTKQMWFETERWDEIAELIGDKVEDLKYAEYGTPQMVKEACYRPFKARHPGAVVARDQDELNSLVKRGMTKVIISEAYYPYIVSTAGYRIEAVAPQKPPADVLKEWLSANKREMRSASIEAFKKQLLVQAVEWRLK